MPPPPRCHVVAGPNGSGKSTFALRYLPQWAGNVEFVNPDLMAQGASPLDIRLSAFEAGKRALRRIRALAAGRVPFAFETTLSGRSHLATLEALRAADARARLEDDLLYIAEAKNLQRTNPATQNT